jgi:carbonic anhydrase
MTAHRFSPPPRCRFQARNAGVAAPAAGLHRWLGTVATTAILGTATIAVHAAPSACETGRRQSPVDIRQTEPARLPSLAFDYRPAPLVADHDGHTVRIRVDNGSALLLGDERLPLSQVHFHTPGGDRLQGEDFPMALHLLHRSRAGQLVPVVVWFRLGAAHEGLQALLPRLPTKAGQSVGVGRRPTATAAHPRPQADSAAPWPVKLDAFTPTAHGYYQYEGSETAPPCREGVRWIVMKQPLTLSAAQLESLQRLFPPNAREVQPLNGRTVQASP